MPNLTRTRFIIIMIATLAIYTIASAMIIGVIVVRSNDPAQAAGDNIIWGGSHFQTEFYKFKERVTQAALDRTPEAADEVRLRYEILLNRLAVFQEGQFRTVLLEDQALSALQQDVERQILALEPTILHADDPAALSRIRPVFNELEQPISRLAAGIGQLGGARFRDLRKGVVTQMYALGGLFLGQILTFALLSFVVGRQVHALDRAQSSLVDANASLSRSEAEARQARQQLYDAIESLGDPFALYDAEDRLVLCNERYRQIFSSPGSSVVPGMQFLDILREFVAAGRVPEAVGREEEWITRRVAGRAAPSGTSELRIDNQWFRRSDRRTGGGGVVTIYSDISGIKEREQRLREQQTILQSVLDHIPVAVTMTDLGARLILINREAENRYDIGSNAIGMTIGDAIPASYRTPTSEQDNRDVLSTGRPIIGREYTLKGPDGEERWLINRVPIFDDTRKIKFILRTAVIVPQLVHAYKELAASRAQLQDAQRRAKLAYWTWEAANGWESVWSEEAANIYGTAPEPVPSDDEAFRRLILEDDRALAIKAHHDIYYEGRPYSIEYRVPQRDGRVVWIRDTGEVLEFDADRKPLRMVGTIQDITAQKLVEEDLRHKEARLRNAQRLARIGTWQWVRESDQLHWSKEALEIFGFGEDKVIQSPTDWQDRIHPDDRAAVSAVV
ncbi:MAG: PAS domain-containing protein, partial [Dongiaceae bacterium]